MEIKRLDENIRPTQNDLVRVKEMGYITEVFYQSYRSKGGYITTIDKDHYVNNQTGEFLKFKHIENRGQDLQNVAKSLGRGRDLLNTNITDVSRCRWVTLTYAENMTDPKKLLFDFQNFNKRLRPQVGHYEYITAAEPQGRGAWHLHVVMLFPGRAPFISNEVMSNAWKQGFVTVKKLDDVDNIGAYLTAYLGDMEQSEAHENFINYKDYDVKTVEFEDENGKKLAKKYVKGARLHMYPAGFHIFRWSKGIKKPLVSMMRENEAEKKISADTLTYEKTVALSDPESEFKNTLNYRYFNAKRTKKQDKKEG